MGPLNHFLIVASASLLLACSQRVEVGERDGGLHTSSSRPDYDECGNGMDDDLDGQFDEGCPCGAMEVQNCFPGTYPHRLIGTCTDGLQLCVTEGSAEIGLWGACGGGTVPGQEVCDGQIDENCDGAIDEGCPCEGSELRDCASVFSSGPCSPGTQRCQEDGVWSSCLGARGPSAELCSDVIDNDCDGLINEGCQCLPEPEVCGDGQDNDCDGQVDEPSCSPERICIERATHVIEIGGDHTRMCALIDDGRVFCWGDNTLGGLGIGEGAGPESLMEQISIRTDPVTVIRDYSSRAMPVPGVSSAREFSSSLQAASCVLSDAGIHCWGPNLSTGYNFSTRRFQSLRWTPTLAQEAQSLGALEQVSAARFNTLALDAGGQVWAWGFSGSGELGNGNLPWEVGDPAVPAMIERAIDLDALAATVCAVQEGGAVYCWGDAGSGQAGELPPGESIQGLPTRIIGIEDAISVEVGQGHACALRQNGRVACWGIDGRRGDGSRWLPTDTGISTLATEVMGLTDARVLESSLAATCAIDRAGRVHCWGQPTLGSPLIGSGVDYAIDGLFDVPVQVAAVEDAVDIALGGLVTEVDGEVRGVLCVLERCGRVRCMGRNNLGQLGNGTTDDSLVLTDVLGLP